MFLSWLKRRRRQRILAPPFPASWATYLEREVGLYRRVPKAEQMRLQNLSRIFMAEKHWEGCGGLAMTDEIRLTVAAQACLLVLGLEDDAFGRVESILIYPTAYRVPDSVDRVTGIVDEDGTGRLGEAWYRGPVILSWEDAQAQARDPDRGRNVVLHEFAHQLDMLDGAIDGTPPLDSDAQARRWREVMTAEYRRLQVALEQGRPTFLDEYGAENETEFFAVATECFFCLPRRLQHRRPRLYETLRDFYRQDPARWSETA